MTELRLSESSACRRIAAARMLARFPQIGGYLLSSRLTLMSFVTLKDVLDEANVDELLERASGLSEPEVRQLVLRMRLGDPPLATPAARSAGAAHGHRTAALWQPEAGEKDASAWRFSRQSRLHSCDGASRRLPARRRNLRLCRRRTPSLWLDA
jgi:hypothetical protein